MKITIACLIVALFWNIAATQQVINYGVRHDPAWLQISHFGENTIPEMTVINTTRRPAIKQVSPGRWQITFPPIP